MPNRMFVSVAVMALFLLLLPACRSRSFDLGAPIPFGPCSLTVREAELAPLFGKQVLAVAIEITGDENERKKLTRSSGMVHPLARYVAVRDSAGKSFHLSTVMDRFAWLSLQRAGTGASQQQLRYLAGGDENIVLIFPVPERTNGFTLGVRNPYLGMKQPFKSLVRLGV